MADVSKYKDLYLSEADDHLQKLNANLIAFEKNPGQTALLDELMRSSHTLKSSSAAMGYKKIAYLTHVLEDVFDFARHQKLNITPLIISTLFNGFDALKQSILQIKSDGPEMDLDPVSAEIKALTGVVTVGIGRSIRDQSGEPVAFGSGQAEVKAHVADIFTQKKAEIPQTEEKIDYIKVPVQRLDTLMNLMEELIVDRMRLMTIVGALPNEELHALSEHLSQLISDLQFQVMQVRLVPVDQIFARFPRLIRDVASEHGKEVELITTGGNIEMDRTIVDKLSEPLVHLIKNAVDHGIEKAGKVTLSAVREKDSTYISVRDNGKGINWSKVSKKAVELGLISQPTDDKAVLSEFLYHPRLTTKEEVSETSGRGIGLSVVQNFVKIAGGRVTVLSPAPEGGTVFTMELPSTLAIISALLVIVGKETIALPFSFIDRLVFVTKEDMKSMADCDVAVIEDMDVPLVRLNSFLFGTESPKPANGKETVILVKRNDEIAGVVVDDLINTQEIIVKPLSSVVRQVKGFSGSTILGDGKSALILDISSLLDQKAKLIRTKKEA